MYRILFLLLCVTPTSLMAANIRVVPDVLPLRVNTPVTLTVYADVVHEVVNAVEASLIFDEKLTYLDASDTDSSVLFWIKYPAVCSGKTVCFSGIAPGGFTGPSHVLASLTFVPKQVGTTTVSFDSIQVLRHDGKGSPVPVATESVHFYIEAELLGAITPATAVDTEPPEAFTTEIVSNPTIHDGAYVIVFETKDKQTKIVSYLIKEYFHPWLQWFTPWRPAESPYVLHDQTLSSYIAVRAVDEAGNERVMIVKPSQSLSVPPHYSITTLALVFAGGGISVYRRHRRRRKYK